MADTTPLNVTGLGPRHPRGSGSNVLMREDFRNPTPGMWNDGVGGATRDTEITLGGLPTARLDTQAVSGSPPSPAAPTLAVPVPSGTGGTFAANTYFWKVTGVVAPGTLIGGPAGTQVAEGAVSTERTVAVAAGGSVPLVWTPVDGYTGYNVYRGVATNAENFVAYVPGGQSVGYLDTGIATGAGVPPGASTAQNPGRTAVTGGVVFKRRFHDSFVDKYGVEVWFRLTSPNNTSNVFPVLSIYNRDGASAFHGRMWLRPQGNNLPLDACILDGAFTAAGNAVPLTGGGAVWRYIDTSTLQNSSGTHLYSPSTGQMDRAGGWHSARLVVDFIAKRYVSLQIDGNPEKDLSAYALDQTTTSGFAGLHASFEYCGSTATQRYMHLAKFEITKETAL